MKLKKGSWFGDYQILTNTPSEWDLIAGGDHEFNISKRPKGMERETILCYEIATEVLLDILDRYPEFRSFMLTRSLVRRSYFNKIKADNLQVILFRRKQEQRSQVVEALGIDNEFLIGEMAEELEKMQGDDQENNNDGPVNAGDTKSNLGSISGKPKPLTEKEKFDKGLTDAIK